MPAAPFSFRRNRPLCSLLAGKVVDVDAIDVRAGERLVGEVGRGFGRQVLHDAREAVALRFDPLDAMDGARAHDGTVCVRIRAGVGARDQAFLHVHLDRHARLPVERVHFAADAG